MATMGDLEGANPNIREQLRIWRGERTANGEDGYDYAAFRQHVMAIGAPDPGEEAPEDFGSAPEAQVAEADKPTPKDSRWQAM